MKKKIFLLVILIGVGLISNYLWGGLHPAELPSWGNLPNAGVVWTQVELMGLVSTYDPLFSDSTNVVLPLIRDAYGWVSSYTSGKEFLIRHTLPITTTAYKYAIGGATGTWVKDIKAVRRKTATTVNVQSLTSVSISDRNKIFAITGSYPDYYALDRNALWLNSAPSVNCSLYVWTYRSMPPSSITSYSTRIPVSTLFYAPMMIQTLAYARQKQGNEVAYVNISQVAQSMLADAVQIYNFVEKQKLDINILPTIQSE